MAGPSVVDQHKHRLAARGIKLDKFIQKEVNNGSILAQWKSTPCGFKFACNDIKALMMALILNPHFGVDTGIGARFQKGPSFREVSKPDGLHIIAFKNGYCNELKTKLNYVNVHLDSVSPVAGRNPKSRGIQYEPGQTVQHALTDLLHLPLKVGGDPKRLSIGFRFRGL